eukprot:SAG11_NODE_2196_length_3699_cov_2.962222_5_plen_106_part_00
MMALADPRVLYGRTAVPRYSCTKFSTPCVRICTKFTDTDISTDTVWVFIRFCTENCTENYYWYQYWYWYIQPHTKIRQIRLAHAKRRNTAQYTTTLDANATLGHT